MFINFTNHKSETWDSEQKKAAEAYGKIKDIPFPEIEPYADENEIEAIAKEKAAEIISFEPCAVLCQGEMSLSFQVIQLLKGNGITVLCATTEHKTEIQINEDGTTEKKSIFKFVRFRCY